MRQCATCGWTAALVGSSHSSRLARTRPRYIMDFMSSGASAAQGCVCHGQTHAEGVEAIEDAFDRIISTKLKQRKKAGKISLKPPKVRRPSLNSFRAARRRQHKQRRRSVGWPGPALHPPRRTDCIMHHVVHTASCIM